MKVELIEKANGILEEIKSLKKYKEMNEGKQKDTFHFEMREHYGDCREIRISRKHNQRLINVIDNIITELEQELFSL